MNSRPTPRPRSSAAGARRHGSRRPADDRGPKRAPNGRAASNGSNDAAKWLPVGAAGALLAVVVGVGVMSSGDGSDAAGGTSVATSATTSSPPIPPPVTTSQIVATPTTAPVQKVALTRTLADGVAGDDVTRVQNRLIELGFDPGPADGIFGKMTIQSVWAFQKLFLGVPSAEAVSTVTPEMWDSMQDPVDVNPRRPQAAGVDHVEIYLPEQVMVVFHSNEPRLVTHISSGELDEQGEPKKYCETIRVDTDPDGNPLAEPFERAICGFAKTPGGIFDVDRFVPGTRNGPLGSMWNPIYFNYGVAIHGALNVPLRPASHGCIRIPMHISEYTQDIIAKGNNVYVWNGKKQPEQQTEQDELPVFDYPDPDATTTTTSTTSTSTTSTLAPATTVAPTTTSAATTTVAPTTSTIATATTTTVIETTTTTTVAPAG